MKVFVISLLAFISVSMTSAHAQWCTSSDKINIESEIALDNLEVLETEISYFYPQRSHLTHIDITSLKSVISNINYLSLNSDYNCIEIKRTFYSSDLNIKNLSRTLKSYMTVDSYDSPISPFWNTFLNSFLVLEQSIEQTPGRYVPPRGPYYRVYFPGFVIRRSIGIEMYPGRYTYNYNSRNYLREHRTRVRRHRTVRPTRRRVRNNRTGPARGGSRRSNSSRHRRNRVIR